MDKKIILVMSLSTLTIFAPTHVFDPGSTLKSACKAIGTEVREQLTPCIVKDTKYLCQDCCDKKYKPTVIRGSGNKFMLNICKATCDCKSA